MLCKKLVGAQCCVFLGFSRIDPGGVHDDGDIFKAFILTQLSQYGLSVHHWHMYVQKDIVRNDSVSQNAERLFSVAGKKTLSQRIDCFYSLVKDLQVFRIVIDVQHTYRLY